MTESITDDPVAAFEFDLDSLAIREGMSRFITKWYGEPCDCEEPDCVLCELWLSVDMVMAEVFDNPFRTGFITGELQ
jgi:hypothetical protein